LRYPSSNYYFVWFHLPNRYKALLGLLGVVVLVGVLRVVRTFWLIQLGKGLEPMCPHCGSLRIRQSGTAFFGDRFYRILGFLPYRCRVCFERFYRSPLAQLASEDEDPPEVWLTAGR
jgi:hypothetical protein